MTAFKLEHILCVNGPQVILLNGTALMLSAAEEKELEKIFISGFKESFAGNFLVVGLGENKEQ